MHIYMLTLCLRCSRLRSPLRQVVQWLWQVVAELSPEEKKLFLKFFTGSDRSPIGGLGNLRCVIQVCERRRAGMGVVGGCGPVRAASPSHCAMPAADPNSCSDFDSTVFGLQRDGPDSTKVRGGVSVVVAVWNQLSACKLAGAWSVA